MTTIAYPVIVGLDGKASIDIGNDDTVRLFHDGRRVPVHRWRIIAIPAGEGHFIPDVDEEHNCVVDDPELAPGSLVRIEFNDTGCVAEAEVVRVIPFYTNRTTPLLCVLRILRHWPGGNDADTPTIVPDGGPR